MFKKIFIIFIINCFVLCLLGCSSRSETLSLPFRLQPTATYLCENPLQIPDYIVSIFPYHGQVISTNQTQTDICVTINVGILLNNEDINWFEANIDADFTVNGVPIDNVDIQSIHLSEVIFCTQSFIDHGTHLVKVDIYANPISTSSTDISFNYMWSFINN